MSGPRRESRATRNVVGVRFSVLKTMTNPLTAKNASTPNNRYPSPATGLDGMIPCSGAKKKVVIKHDREGQNKPKELQGVNRTFEAVM